MALRVEWRTQGETNDAIVVLDPDQKTVHQAAEADPTLIRAFLTDEIAGINKTLEGKTVADGGRDPEAWGALVMARATTGEVLDMDVERYWDAIYFWFRSRGIDPHARP